MDPIALILLVVALGLVFEFINGFHDAANAIATVVATRVLPPQQAVIMAGCLNLLGAFSGTAVATTLGSGLVEATSVSQATVAAGLIAAITWDLATWYLGLPVSSSHALIFGVIGAAVATSGFEAIIPAGITKVFAGLVYSPFIGFFSAMLVMAAVYWLFRKATWLFVTRLFGRLQLLSSAWMAFSHGGNDGQKTMGVIALALYSGGFLGDHFYVPAWVIVASATAIGVGTMMGGWRIVRTVGMGIADLQPVHGFAAETAAGSVIEIATRFGVPISTTHAISAAIMGVGSARGLRKVRWLMAGQIVAAWVFTLPICFVLGWLVRHGMVLLGW